MFPASRKEFVKNWLEENWFKIALVVLASIALVFWHQTIQNDRIRDFLMCQKGTDSSEYSICASYYLDLIGVKK